MQTSPHTQEGTIRLAECDTVAVDLCACGTFHVHVGALSLRMKADGAASLLQTLGLAFARRQALRIGAEGAGELLAALQGEGRAKGEA